MTRWLSRLAAMIVSVGIGLVVVEAALRLVWLRRMTVSAGLEHPHFHHRQKPETTYHYKTREFDVHIRTNRYGLRGPDPALPKPAGVARVLMLGDSFTFGFPVRDGETFVHLIGEGLRAQGHSVDVVNGAVSTYSPTLHYVSLRDQFLAFEPDLVVLWFDLADAQDDYRYQKNLLYSPEGAILRCDPRYINGRFDQWEFLKNHLALAKYIDNKFVRTVAKIRTLGLQGYLAAKLRGERAKAAISRLKSGEEDQDLLEYDRLLLARDDANPTRIEAAWELSARYLRMIRALLAERDIPFVLGVYPYGMAVAADEWVDGRVYRGFDQGRVYDATTARILFRRFALAERVPLVDTFEAFREAAVVRTEPLFYNWDGHFTPAGHQVLAEAAVRDSAFQRIVRKAVQRSRSAARR